MAKSATRFGQERKFSDQAPAIGSGSAIPTIQFSTGRASALANFSRTLFGLSAQFEDQLDAQAEAEASKEGAIAGLAGNTEEQSYETVRGRAYNKAMLETAVTSIDTKAMIGMARLQQQYYDDPVGLERATNDFLGGMSEEVEKFAPGAGASFRARQTARALPAVEQARDTKFKMTRDEADALLIEHEAVTLGNIKKNAQGLFSANPAQSSAASMAVAQSFSDYMRTYDAVDPITGRPLYSESDKAKARVYIKDKITSEATLSWFDAQPDKAAAYLKAQDPDFKFNINLPAEKPGNVTYANQGSTRSQKIQPQVMSWLETASGAMGPNIGVLITSGGQPTKEEIRLARLRGENIGGRTGSNRHDHGGSADVVLTVNGKKVTPAENPALYKQFVENAAAAGAPGIGHYSWGVHIGGGSTTAWGPDTTGDTLDPEYSAAISRGRGKKGGLKLGEAKEFNVPLKSAMSETAWNNLDSEMRQRITFMNTQTNQARLNEERVVKAEQDAAKVEVATRIYAAGKDDPATGQPVKPITELEVTGLVRDGLLEPGDGAAFIKAISTEKPDRSDAATYAELQRRMWNGEDVQDDILNASDRLKAEDRNSLLSKNRELRNSEGSLSTEAQRQYQALGSLLKTPGAFGQIDQAQSMRSYEAQQEFLSRYQKRDETGENLADIVRDIKGRFYLDMTSYTGSALDALGLPRFAIAGDRARSVNVAETAKALLAARQKGSLLEEDYQEQIRLLKSWDAGQKALAEQESKAANSKGK